MDSTESPKTKSIVDAVEAIYSDFPVLEFTNASLGAAPILAFADNLRVHSELIGEVGKKMRLICSQVCDADTSKATSEELARRFDELYAADKGATISIIKFHDAMFGLVGVCIQAGNETCEAKQAREMGTGETEREVKKLEESKEPEKAGSTGSTGATGATGSE